MMAFEERVETAREKLCQPNLFFDAKNNPSIKDKFKIVCCPDFPPKTKSIPCICPWSPIYANSTFYDGGHCMYPTKFIFPYISG